MACNAAVAVPTVEFSYICMQAMSFAKPFATSIIVTCMHLHMWHHQHS
jgi:hypothetical protein